MTRRGRRVTRPTSLTTPPVPTRPVLATATPETTAFVANMQPYMAMRNTPGKTWPLSSSWLHVPRHPYRLAIQDVQMAWVGSQPQDGLRWEKLFVPEPDKDIRWIYVLLHAHDQRPSQVSGMLPDIDAWLEQEYPLSLSDRSFLCMKAEDEEINILVLPPPLLHADRTRSVSHTKSKSSRVASSTSTSLARSLNLLLPPLANTSSFHSHLHPTTDNNA